MTLALLTTMAIGLGGIALGFRRGLLSPLFLFMMMYTIGVPIRALILLSHPDEFLPPWSLNRQDASQLERALFEQAIGGMVLLVGYVTCVSSGIGQAAIRPLVKFLTPGQGSLPAKKLAWVVVGSFVAYAGLLLVAVNPDPLQLIIELQGRSVAPLEGKYYVTVLIDLCLVAALCWINAKGLSISRLGTLAILILPVIGLGLLGSRGSVIQAVLMVAVVFSVCSRAYVYPSFKVALVGVLFVSITVLGLAARTSAQHGGSLSERVSSVAGDGYLVVSNAMPLVDQQILAGSYVSERGHDYGAQLLSLPTRVIPKAVFGGKEDTLSLKIRHEFWHDRLTGVPAGAFGEMIIFGGVAGLIVWGFYYGVVIALIETLYVKAMTDPRLAVVAAILIAFLPTTFLRSGIETGLIRLLIYVVLLVGLNQLLSRRQSSSETVVRSRASENAASPGASGLEFL